jgi:hypothetical protein
VLRPLCVARCSRMHGRRPEEDRPLDAARYRARRGGDRAHVPLCRRGSRPGGATRTRCRLARSAAGFVETLTPKGRGTAWARRAGSSAACSPRVALRRSRAPRLMVHEAQHGGRARGGAACARASRRAELVARADGRPPWAEFVTHAPPSRAHRSTRARTS